MYHRGCTVSNGAVTPRAVRTRPSGKSDTSLLPVDPFPPLPTSEGDGEGMPSTSADSRHASGTFVVQRSSCEPWQHCLGPPKARSLSLLDAALQAPGTAAQLGRAGAGAGAAGAGCTPFPFLCPPPGPVAARARQPALELDCVALHFANLSGSIETTGAGHPAVAPLSSLE